MTELPEGWAEASIGECFLEMRNGTTANQNKYGKGVPVSRIETIQNGKFDLKRVQHIDDASAELVKAFCYRPGDIAFSHINSYEHVGKTALYEGAPKVFLHGMNLLRLRLGHRHVDPKFAYLYLQTAFFRDEVRQRVGHAVNQVSINQKNLASVPFLLPPCAEQRRIVAKLEELLGKAETCQKRLAKIPIILKRFRQSVLAAACSGRLTAEWRDDSLALAEATDGSDGFTTAEGVEPSIDVPEGWQWVALDALCDGPRGICYGVIKLGGEESNGVPCLRTSDVKWLRIDSNRVKRIAPELSEQYGRSVLRGGEILVNVRGTLGGVAVVPVEMRGWNVSREVSVVPVVAALPQFVALCIASKTSQNWLAGVEKGVAYTGINLKDLRDLPVPVPRSAEQKEIVRRVEALFKFADQIEAHYKKAQAQVDKLTQSILAKAFRGELVPTEAELARRESRDYEPAGELLTRIRSGSSE